jgi:hypothetical protein
MPQKLNKQNPRRSKDDCSIANLRYPAKIKFFAG